MRRYVSYILLALCCLCLDSALFPKHVSAAGVQALPAPMPGSERPTITLAPTHATPGATVSVSGQAVADLPAVQIVWLLPDSTFAAAIAERSADNSYQIDIVVPDMEPGPIQICAAPTGSELAAFVCADFTVDAPPPGTVTAQFPEAAQYATASPSALNAKLTLYRKDGTPVASAPFAGNGSVTIPNVPPGTYNAAVVGFVPFLVQNVQVTVTGGGAVTVPLVPTVGCFNAQVAAVRLSPSGAATSEYDFGPFIADAFVKIPLTLQADLQIVEGATVSVVSWKTATWGITAFSYEAMDFTTFQAEEISSEAIFYYGTVAGLQTLTVTPEVRFDGNFCGGLPTTRTIFLIDNPFEINPFTRDISHASYIPLSWNGNGYNFELKLPSAFDYDYLNSIYDYDAAVPGLPVEFPKPAPAFPLIGKVSNTFNVGTHVKGTIGLDGSVNFEIADARYRARIFGTGVYSDETHILPTAALAGQVLASRQFLVTNPNGLRAGNNLLLEPLSELLTFTIDETLASFDHEVPVFSTILANLPPIAIVTLSVSMGVKGELTLKGTMKPLVPRLDLELRARAQPRVSLDLEIIVLLGAASGGASAITQGDLILPIHLTTSGNDPIYTVEPCFRIDVLARIWFRVLFFKWDETERIAEFSEGNCPSQAGIAQADLPPLPNVLAAPAVASAPNGQSFLAYVADTTTTPNAPKTQVLASFKDTATGVWGESIAVSDGTHPVNSAVVAFAGPTQTPMIVWVETVVTPAEATALMDDALAAVARQELYFSTWDGTQWLAPTRLTNDAFTDGAPALAGDANGATLLWIRNTSDDLSIDGSAIGVMTWTGGAWSAPALLPTPAGKLNTQVAVARAAIDDTNSRELAVWTVDSDGDLNTPDDRTLAIMRRDALADDWTAEDVSALPPGVDKPSVALDANDVARAFVAFVKRGVNMDGSAAGVGNQSQVWTAQRDINGVWSGSALLDGAGAMVRGESPRIGVSATGEPLVLMRRFGEVGTHAELGQMALTQIQPDGTAAPPIYLTDSPAQQWQSALAIDPSTGEALAVSVERAPVTEDDIAAAATLAPAVRGAMSAPDVVTLVTNDDPLNIRTVLPDADPALDPQLVFSQPHPPTGATVTISATVRNLGRTSVQPSVSFYRGTPGSGTLLDTIAVPVLLGFNESAIVTLDIESQGGRQPLYAEVTGASNASDQNDIASGELGILPAPDLLTAIPQPDTNAVLLNWQAIDAPGVAGYRVLRRMDGTQAYELVGETARANFTDYLLAGRSLTGDVANCYVVQAFDSVGERSASSREACASYTPVDFSLFLPSTRR